MFQTQRYDPFGTILAVIRGGRLFAIAYDRNPIFPRKRRYDRGDGVSYYHHRLYNTENKMVQVLTINGSTVTRQSDQFYHLDGSRLWEGINRGTQYLFRGIEKDLTRAVAGR